LALAGLWYLLRTARDAALFLLLMLLVPLFVVEVLQPHYVYMRFFLFLLPAFLTLLACGLQQVSLWLAGNRAGRSSLQWVLLGGLCSAFVALTAPGLVRVMTLPKQDFAGAAEALRTEIARGQKVAL